MGNESEVIGATRGLTGNLLVDINLISPIHTVPEDLTTIK